MNSEKQVIRLNMQEIDGGYYTCDKCGKEVPKKCALKKYQNLNSKSRSWKK